MTVPNSLHSSAKPQSSKRPFAVLSLALIFSAITTGIAIYALLVWSGYLDGSDNG